MSLTAVSLTNNEHDTTLNVYLEPGENLKLDINGSNVFEAPCDDLKILDSMIQMAIAKETT